ncbi:MAG TPA: O-antigen ligase family protein [Ramlibacter sp.]|uniref:O-antigen ligase family protein n=1 Tax=Ramlibacter sp. TaxID=1917967 RepID=UPI002D3B41A6|nr:O-antigen ligase family protein [Ramlibacter sp.]HZY18643.1 O-antigen ligase family protein [Ramlibacter sp.]
MPAVGVPHELLLQDTLKSMLVAFAVLGAAAWFFWREAGAVRRLLWHDVLWLPLLLTVWALGSMVWSHAYLGGVEAVRWFLFALLLWTGLQVLRRERLPGLALGIQGGVVLAALWAALQFWADLRLFPQGPNPASTFANRNFFAEYAVTALPFQVLLLAYARRPAAVVAQSLGVVLVVVAIFMTGTRAALAALSLQLLLVLPLAAWRLRTAPAMVHWTRPAAALAAAVLVVGALGLGSIPSGNPRILAENNGVTALERAMRRGSSIGVSDPSIGLRLQLWQATLRMIADHPLAGVGAGAWEVQVPNYHADDVQLELDQFAHNEPLQLLAENGLVGAAFLLGLLAYLLRAAWTTWRLPASASDEGPWRVAALSSLLALLVVSNAGFPWHLAGTGALFAVGLAVLAASDARLGRGAVAGAGTFPWHPAWRAPALALIAGWAALAGFISLQATQGERKIVRATQLALAISAAGDWNAPRWRPARDEVVRLTREAIAIHPDDRRIAPAVADELARWGDWRNATWVWESVLRSRPFVVAILTNAGRGHVVLGDTEGARRLLERARAVAPEAPSVLSLEALLLSRADQHEAAARLARRALAQGRYDELLLDIAFTSGWRLDDADLVERAAALRVRAFPASRGEQLVQLGRFRWERGDRVGAGDAWAQAVAQVAPERRTDLLDRLPPEARPRLTR